MPIVVPTPNTVITSAWGKSVADTINENIPRELAYAQVTAAVNPTGVTAPTANTVVGTGALTLDGRAVLIEFYAPQMRTGTGVGTSLILNLWDGATDLGYMAQAINPGTGGMTVPCHFARRLVPSAGSHAYSVRVWVPAGAGGSIGAGPGGIDQVAPAFIRVSRAT